MFYRFGGAAHSRVITASHATSGLFWCYREKQMLRAFINLHLYSIFTLRVYNRACIKDTGSGLFQIMGGCLCCEAYRLLCRFCLCCPSWLRIQLRSERSALEVTSAWT